MPDAEGPPPITDMPAFTKIKTQYASDAEILKTAVAETLLKLGEGDLGQQVEEIAGRMQTVYRDTLFGLVDPVLEVFAAFAVAKPDIARNLVDLNMVNKYLHIRDVMDAWREFVTTKGIASKILLDRNRLIRWIMDLQSGMYVNCVYCGHRYGPYGEKPAQEALTRHVDNCEHHPLFKARQTIASMQATGYLHPRELNTILGALRMYQEAGADKAAMSVDVEDVISDGGEHTALTASEVDSLCERLNGATS